MRLGCVLAQALDAVGLIGLKVALEPIPVARVLVGALPCQDVRGNTVQEHTVVANDDRTARELEQRGLERGQGLDVQVVRGLVEQQQVAALLKRERQVQTVTLAAGEHAGALLLVLALKAKARHIGATGNLGLADHHVVQAVRDDLPQILVGVDARTVLVDVGDLDGLAHFELARSQRLQAHDRLEQRGLTDAVGADDAHDAVARQGERKVIDEHAAIELFVQMMGLEHLVAQTRAHRDANVGPVELLACAGLGLHLLVASQTGLVLGLAGLGRAAHPLELGLHALGEFGVAVALRLDTRGLGLQIRGVIALVGIKVTTVDLADPLGNVIQEVAIVRDGKHRALVVMQEVLEPQDRLSV